LNTLKGWTLLAAVPYSEQFSWNPAWSSLPEIIIACGKTGESTVAFAAMGNTTQILAPTRPPNAVNLVNGAYFYNDPAAMGFSKESNTARSSCDTIDEPFRLCWHKDSRGYRCGVWHSNEDNLYSRYVFG